MYVDVIGGFLGSGKTTTIINLLRERAIDPGKTVLLVNEFGKVGVDGALLEGEGGAVKELASGCICCTLKADFMAQIEEISATFAPEHVVVEPSGVASMRDILQALTHTRVAPLITDLRTVLVLDVDDYDWFVQMSEQFVEAQIGLSQLILVNKTDLASPEAVAEVIADLEKRNPHAVIMPTTFGRFSWAEVDPLLSPVPSPDGPTARLEGFESFSEELPEVYDREAVRRLFAEVASGSLGEILRAKAVVHTPEGCMRIDLASRRVHETDWSCFGPGRVNIVGKGIDQEGIRRSLAEAVDRSAAAAALAGAAESV